MPCLQLLGLLCDKLLSIEIILDEGEFPKIGSEVNSAAIFGKSITGIRDRGLHTVCNLYSAF